MKLQVKSRFGYSVQLPFIGCWWHNADVSILDSDFNLLQSSNKGQVIGNIVEPGRAGSPGVFTKSAVRIVWFTSAFPSI